MKARGLLMSMKKREIYPNSKICARRIGRESLRGGSSARLK